MDADRLRRNPPQFVDAHAHIWSWEDGERFPMRTKIAALQRDFTLTELIVLQQTCGVAAVVLIQAVDNAGESLRLLELAQGSAGIAGVVCWVDPLDQRLPRLLAQYRAHPKFVGVRPMQANTFGVEWIVMPAAHRFFDVLHEADCAVDFLVPVSSLARLHDALVLHPGLRCVLNHGGRPNVLAGMSETWRRDMRRLAQDTSLVVKCSGLAERAGVEWTSETLKPFIGHLLETFGIGRVMFASNWPILTLAAGYALWLETVLRVLDDFGLNTAAVDAVMRTTAENFYRLGKDPANVNPVDKETPWH